MKETVVQTITLEQVLDQPQTLSGLLEEVLEATAKPGRSSKYRHHFVVDRSRWISGCIEHDRIRTGPVVRWSGSGGQRLLNNSGCMCCLGFVSVQLGVSENSMLEQCLPADVDDFTPEFRDVLLDGASENSQFAIDAADINDDCQLTQERREEKLIEHFHAHGYDLKFTGAYA